jgi:predicted transcriptional regulator
LKTNTVQTLWDRRDRLGILAEILETAKGKQGKTKIMYKVNLSFSQVNEYLSFLTEMGFIKIQKERGKKTYETTSKGYSFIDNYVEMSQLLTAKELQAPMIPEC